MDSRKPNSHYDLSSDAKFKKSSLFKRILGSSSFDPLYNTRLIAQEYEPNANWTMPEIEPSKIYDLPMFKFRATTLIRYCSTNVPLSLGQNVY
jgi:hypothetical protein